MMFKNWILAVTLAFMGFFLIPFSATPAIAMGSSSTQIIGLPGNTDFPNKPSDVSSERWSGLKSAIRQTKLMPAGPDLADKFGWSVSLDGDRALIGAYQDDDNGPSSGSAYVFEFDGSNWFFSAKLTPSDGAAEDQFGRSVSLSGNRALVGAPSDDDNGSDSGSAYVFDLIFNLEGPSLSWVESSKLTPADGVRLANFGFSVSLLGNRAVVGAFADNENGNSSGSAYVFDFDNNNWSETTKLTPADGEDGDWFGWSVSLYDNQALIGARNDTANGVESGSAYVFKFDGISWGETAKLTSSDGAVEDWFGWSVSLFGDFALIGALGDDDNGLFSGSAYVFEYDGTSWSETEKLTPSDGELGGNFGYSVSLFGDRALIGAIGTGAAYAFVLNNSGWVEASKLMPVDDTVSGQFGLSVSLSGNRALISDPQDFNVNLGNEPGSFVFDFDGSSWSETVKLRSNDGAEFGFSISLYGSRALVGARGGDDNGFDSGSAYLFDYNSETNTWTQTAKLTAGDAAAFDNFGCSVGLAGGRALVGACQGDNDNALDSGSVYVFDYNSDTSTWAETAKLTASDGAVGDNFGSSVSLSGNRALIGARLDNDNGLFSGSAYMFNYNSTTNSWTEADKLIARDGAAFDNFGYSVSLSGNRALVGADGDDDNGSDSGSAYVFDFNGSTWSETTKLTASDGAANHVFGVSVSLSGNRALVGAAGDDDNGSSSGSAYIFNYNSTTNSWTEADKLIASDGAAGDIFGVSVSLSGDRALVGAYGDDDNGSNSGSAYLFDFNTKTSSWTETAKLTAEDSTLDVWFGWSVSLSGDLALVGARFDNDSSRNFGSAYVFWFNQPPIAQSDLFIAYEDTELTGQVLEDNGFGADFDPDGDPLFIENPGIFSANGLGGTINLQSNGSFTYNPPSDVTGQDSFSYLVSDPSGEVDSAGVTITVQKAADLVIEKTSGSFFTQPGGNIEYLIVIVNNGPSDVIGARVIDLPPPRLSSVNWTCSELVGASCQNNSGFDLIDQFVDIDEGGSLLFILNGTLSSIGNDPINNTAEVSNSSFELEPSNNIDGDTDVVGLFADSMESIEP